MGASECFLWCQGVFLGWQRAFPVFKQAVPWQENDVGNVTQEVQNRHYDRGFVTAAASVRYNSYLIVNLVIAPNGLKFGLRDGFLKIWS